MATHETYTETAGIELYRNDKLYRASNDEEFTEYEGLEAIPDDESAEIVIRYAINVTREPATYDPPYPGHYEAEKIMDHIYLEVGFRETLRKIQLPIATQDAIWWDVYDELEPV